jgi:hypothetical protein
LFGMNSAAVTRTFLPIGLLLSAVGVSVARPAQADDAVVHVKVPEFAPPPPVATDPEPPPPVPHDYEPPRNDWRVSSPVRLSIGGVGVTTGRSVGPGLGIGLDAGRGSLGFRLSAAWLRHEPDGSPISGPLSQYTGELTLDLNHRGPWHPIVGIGFGVAYLSRADQSGYLGVGTGRLALEYALGLDDVDVRVGAGIMGVMPGPTDREVQDVRGYALVATHLAIGF